MRAKFEVAKPMRGVLLKFRYFLVLQACVLALASVTAKAGDNPPRVIMAADAWSPFGESGKGWEPQQSVVDELERLLPVEVQKAARPYQKTIRENLNSYGRQYLGIGRLNRKLIFVNGFCHSYDIGKKDLKKEIVYVFDGGECFFHGTYDPEKKLFEDFQINGEA